jgi:hypothetical protein
MGLAFSKHGSVERDPGYDASFFFIGIKKRRISPAFSIQS